MARFCVGCGSQISEGAAFCAGCGKPAAPGPAAPAPGPPPVNKGSPLLKILLICVAVVMVLGALGIAGIIYAGYRVKQRVEQAAKRNGIDLGAITSAPTGRRLDPCKLLTKEDAAEILAMPVIRADRRGDACEYFIRPVSAEQKEEDIRKAVENVTRKADEQKDKPEPKNGNEVAERTGLEALTKKIGAAANDGSTPILTVTASDDGPQKIAAMKLTLGAIGGRDSFERLTGLGDDAILGPLSSILLVVKDGAAAEIDLRQVPNGRERGIEMAKRIVSRM